MLEKFDTKAKNETSLNSEEKAKLIASAISEKKGKDIRILKLKDLSLIADYFVITTGNNPPQIQTIAEHIIEQLGLKPHAIEGLQSAKWVVLDYGDVIVHIFDEEKRQYFALEKLWLDAPVVL